MSTFENLSYGLIKEVGEDDILLNVNGKDIEIELTADIKQPIFDAIEEGIYMLPFDNVSKKIIMTVDTQTAYEVFPESDLEELEGSTNELPKEHE